MVKNRVLGLGLACVLAVSLMTGCSNSRTKNIDGTVVGLTVNDTTVNMGTIMTMLRYHQALMHDYYQNMYDSYAASGMNVVSSPIWDNELTSEDDVAVEEVSSESVDVETETEESVAEDTETENTETESAVEFPKAIEAKTYGQQFLNNVVDGLVEYVVTNEHAEEYGESLTGAEKSAIMVAAEEFCGENDEKMLKLNGITVSDVANYLEIYTLYQKVYHAYVDKADIEISDEDARCMTISYVQFASTVTGEDETSQEGVNEGLKQDAEAFLAVCKDTKDIATADLGELAVNEGYDYTFSGEETMAVHDSEGQYMFPVEDIEAIGALKEGEVYDKVLVTDDGTAYVIRLDKAMAEEETEEYRKQLHDSKADEEFLKEYEGWRLNSTVEYNTDALQSVSISDADVYTIVDDEVETEAGSENVEETGSSESVVDEETVEETETDKEIDAAEAEEVSEDASEDTNDVKD